MGLKWSSIFCPQAKYVMKTDDDIYVNVPLLHTAVKKSQKQFSIHINGKCEQHLISKYIIGILWSRGNISNISILYYFQDVLRMV